MSDVVGRLRQVGDNAPKAPWEYDAAEVVAHGEYDVGEGKPYYVVEVFDNGESGVQSREAGEFIATARNVWDALLDVAECAEQVVAEDHADTCRYEVTDGAAPCSCGVWDLRAALSRLDEVNLP